MCYLLRMFMSFILCLLRNTKICHRNVYHKNSYWYQEEVVVCIYYVKFIGQSAIREKLFPSEIDYIDPLLLKSVQCLYNRYFLVLTICISSILYDIDNVGYLENLQYFIYFCKGFQTIFYLQVMLRLINNCKSDDCKSFVIILYNCL